METQNRWSWFCGNTIDEVDFVETQNRDFGIIWYSYIDLKFEKWLLICLRLQEGLCWIVDGLLSCTPHRFTHTLATVLVGWGPTLWRCGMHTCAVAVIHVKFSFSEDLLLFLWHRTGSSSPLGLHALGLRLISLVDFWNIHAVGKWSPPMVGLCSLLCIHTMEHHVQVELCNV